MRRHPEIPFWLCVGDVGDDRGVYEPVPAPLYWIKGNNEDFDFIACLESARGAGVPNAQRALGWPAGVPNAQRALGWPAGGKSGEAGPWREAKRSAGEARERAEGWDPASIKNASPYVVENLHYTPNAELIEIDGLRVAGVGGTFAPTWYDKKASELPSGLPAGGTRLQPRPGDLSARGTRLQPRPDETTLKGRATSAGKDETTFKDRATGTRKRDDKRRHFVRDEVEAVRRMRGLDVLLTHEAPRPFRVGRFDAGKTPINEMIASARPRLHLFGHHHRFAESIVSGVRSVCLDSISTSYLLVERATLAYERRDTTSGDRVAG